MRPFGSDPFILLLHAGGGNEENLRLMRRIDEQYTKVPFYGVRRLTAWLRAQGYIVNPKRVRVLMR
jgi:putative transposase